MEAPIRLSYYASWTIYTISFAILILVIQLLNPTNAFLDSLLLIYSLWMLLTTMFVVPIIAITLSVLRIVAFQRFGEHQINMLAWTSNLCSFLPIVLVLHVLITSRYSAALLARTLIEALVIPTLSVLVSFLVLALSFHGFCQRAGCVGEWDSLTMFPHLDSGSLTCSEPVMGTAWLLLIQFCKFAAATYLLAVAVRTAIRHDHDVAMKKWMTRWAMPRMSWAMQIYAIPGEGLIVLQRTLSHLGRVVVMKYKKVKQFSLYNHRSDTTEPVRCAP